MSSLAGGKVGHMTISVSRGASVCQALGVGAVNLLEITLRSSEALPSASPPRDTSTAARPFASHQASVASSQVPRQNSDDELRDASPAGNWSRHRPGETAAPSGFQAGAIASPRRRQELHHWPPND